MDDIVQPLIRMQKIQLANEIYTVQEMSVFKCIYISGDIDAFYKKKEQEGVTFSLYIDIMGKIFGLCCDIPHDVLTKLYFSEMNALIGCFFHVNNNALSVLSELGFKNEEAELLKKVRELCSSFIKYGMRLLDLKRKDLNEMTSKIDAEINTIDAMEENRGSLVQETKT